MLDVRGRTGRLFAVLLVLAGMLCVGAAFAEDAPVTYVDNPVRTDRLHLRAAPRQSAASLGRYYSGAVVTVLDEEGEWAHVTVGAGDAVAEGYMMRQFLTTVSGEDRYGIQDLQPTAWVSTLPDERTLPLRANPSTTAPAIEQLENGRYVWILGDIGEDWAHVIFYEAGVPRAGYLHNTDIIRDIPIEYSSMAMVRNPSPGKRVQLRAAPSDDARSLGLYYTGVPVSVFGTSGEWTQVLIGSGAEGLTRIGYIQTQYLDADVDWSLKESEIAYARIDSAQGEVTVYENPSDKAKPQGPLRNGALVWVLADAGGWCHITTENMSGYVRADALRLLEERYTYAYANTHVALGYATLYQPEGAARTTDEAGRIRSYRYCEEVETYYASLTDGGSVLVLSEMDGWLQVKSIYYDTYFVPSANVKALYHVPGLSGNAGTYAEHKAGTYTVGKELDADIYALVMPEGGTGSATVFLPDGTEQRTHMPDPQMPYNVYLAEGMRITVTGDLVLAPMDTARYPVSASMNDPSNTGVGRFLAGINCEDGGIHVKVKPGYSEGYYTISTFENETAEPAAPVRVEPGEGIFVPLDTGNFIEIVDCVYWVNG